MGRTPAYNRCVQVRRVFPCPVAIRLVATLTLAGVLSGCASLGYYGQAVGGHLDLMSRREPIDRLISDPQTDPALRSRLETVRRMRRFASEQLGLPDNRSYTQYADLERDAAVYLLTAAPELSLEPRRWCYLVVGCLTYRGLFSAERAEKEAEALRGQGMDVRVSPSLAYSTLGFTADPVLNTMLVYPDHQLAAILFHELAHQVVYVKGDAAFSESFASAVEAVGQERWLEALGKAMDPERLTRERQRERQFNRLMLGARDELAALFSSPIDDSEKRLRKTMIYDRLGQDYQRLRESWDGYPGFDHWFEDGPNNADLALLSTYQSQVPDFLALLEALDGDLRAFYARVKAIARMHPDQRRAALSASPSGH